MRKYIQLLLLFVGFVSCEPWGGMHGMQVENNSDLEISFYSYSLLYGQFYPDTILKQDTLKDYSLSHVKPHSHIWMGTGFTYREIKKGNIPYYNDTLMFFVFSRDTLRKYSWEEIKRDYKILKRYDITGRQLNDQNWTITYP